MVGHIITALRQSRIVKSLDVLELVEEESVQFLRARAEIIDGSMLHVRELFAPPHSKYSYHWQSNAGAILLRWDNAPHHPEIPTHPDHRHEGGQVAPSSRASIEEVLAELEARVSRKR